MKVARGGVREGRAGIQWGQGLVWEDEELSGRTACFIVDVLNATDRDTSKWLNW